MLQFLEAGFIFFLSEEEPKPNLTGSQILYQASCQLYVFGLSFDWSAVLDCMCPLWLVSHRSSYYNVLSCLKNFTFNKYFMKLKQRKSQLWRRFGYLVLISIRFDNFTSQALTTGNSALVSFFVLFCFSFYIKCLRKLVFHWLSRYLKFHQKYPMANCHIFNCLPSVWISWCIWNTVY